MEGSEGLWEPGGSPFCDYDGGGGTAGDGGGGSPDGEGLDTANAAAEQIVGSSTN